MNFSVVIPNYNGEAFLDDCIKSINSSIKQCPNIKVEIIIVDNGSINPPKNTTIFLNKNMGFGEAVNRGMKRSKYEYIIVMNNDLTIETNWFQKITSAINNNPNYACYYGLVLNIDGSKIESEGFKYFMSGKAININNGKKYIKNSKLNLPAGKAGIKNFPIWGCPASIVIYKKEILNKLNGFDASFFAYIEDVDLAYRLAKNNYKTLYIPSAISYHLGGGTSSKMGYLREWLSFRNWIKLINKNYTLTQKIIYFIPIFIERLRNLKYLLVKLLKL